MQIDINGRFRLYYDNDYKKLFLTVYTTIEGKQYIAKFPLDEVSTDEIQFGLGQMPKKERKND